MKTNQATRGIHVALAASVSLALAMVMSAAVQAATVNLDPRTSYQSVTGWDVALLGTSSVDMIDVLSAMDDIADQAVNDLGINRVQLSLASGAENPVDYGTQFINGQIPESEFFTGRYGYQIVNDNTDPYDIDPNGFQWSLLDWTVDNVLLPLKQAAEASGEHLFIYVSYVDFAASPFEHYDDPEEYAEFVLATYHHLESKYGIVLDAWEVIVEPDNSAWNGTHIGNCILAAANRLKANGYTPRFIAPSNTSMSESVTYFDDVAQVLGTQLVRQYVEQFSYHRYHGVSDASLQAIANRAVQYGINTSMLEWWSTGNSFKTLHKDLKMGRNSAWQQGVLAESNATTTGLFIVDISDPNNPVVTPQGITKFTRQYFKFIGRGALRIEASSDNVNFDPLAFVSTDGGYVVVVWAHEGGPVSIQGLPAGTYGIKYTTGNGRNVIDYDVDLPDSAIAPGGTLTTGIPDQGVITIYAKSAVPSSGKLQFSAASYGVGEADRSTAVEVIRAGGSSGPVTVEYATAGGTATANADYVAVSGVLRWSDGDMTPKSFILRVLEDTLEEGAETVGLVLSNPTGGASIGSPGSAVLTISDDSDDGPTGIYTLFMDASTTPVLDRSGPITMNVLGIDMTLDLMQDTRGMLTGNGAADLDANGSLETPVEVKGAVKASSNLVTVVTELKMATMLTLRFRGGRWKTAIKS
jgi:hypothetical protein